MTMIERFEITDFEKWGKLVRSWATGKNRLEDGKPDNAYPIPTGLVQFTQQCVAAGVGATIPGYVTDVQFVQAGRPGPQTINAPTIGTMVFRLPPKELVEDSENQLLGGSASYTIPKFYNRIFGKPGGPTAPTTASEIMKLHAERIGEYTMNVCQ
jgi:hypothetical protein